MPNITKAYVESMREPGLYRDDKLTGFRLKVTASGSKIYLVCAKVKGNPRPVKVTIGRHGNPWTLERAKQEGSRLLLMMRQGINPNENQRNERQKIEAAEAIQQDDKNRQSLTVEKVFADYLESRKLKASTRKVYTYVVNSRFKDWLARPLLSITRDMVERRHKDISLKHPGDADHAMRILRAVWGHAQGKYEDSEDKTLFGENPVKRISQTKAWNRLQRRQTLIKDHQLKAWYSAVMALEDTTARDYLRLILLTGLRKQEAMKLTWDNVDMKGKTLMVVDTKNNKPHVLPLSRQLYEMLRDRWQERLGDYVFPHPIESGYPLRDVRSQIADVEDRSKIKFMLHDCRRTFATIAMRIATQYELKKLLNHKDGSDVTGGYLIADAENLRPVMQEITDCLLSYVGSSRALLKNNAPLPRRKTRKQSKKKLNQY